MGGRRRREGGWTHLKATTKRKREEERSGPAFPSHTNKNKLKDTARVGTVGRRRYKNQKK